MEKWNGDVQQKRRPADGVGFPADRCRWDAVQYGIRLRERMQAGIPLDRYPFKG